MFDIGWTELVVVACVAILVVGPKDLPKMLRAFGKTVGNLRRMAGDFQRQFDQALKETELDEVRKASSSFKPLEDVRKTAQSFQNSVKDSVREIEKDASVSEPSPTPAKAEGKAGASTKPAAAKPAGQKAAKPKTAKAKTAAAKPAPAKPASDKPVPAKPAATRTAAAKPAGKAAKSKAGTAAAKKPAKTSAKAPAKARSTATGTDG